MVAGPSTRLAGAVRSARQRLGWTRERLAHESDLSFAAITQIEAGRRAEVRASTLVALAEALGVSVDYLVRPDPAAPMLQHRAYLYESQKQLVELTEPVLQNALDAGNTILVVATKPSVAAIRGMLGAGARRVTFADSATWYTTPPEAAERYEAFVRDARNVGADWVEMLGEPTWPGCGRAEAAAWARYEALTNLIFAPWPVNIGCIYDAATPPRVRSELERTHQEIVTAQGAHASSTFASPGQLPW